MTNDLSAEDEAQATAPNRFSRRAVLGSGGALGALVLIGGVARTADARAATGAADAAADCTLIEPGEIGPFFVDGQLERSDVRRDSATGTLQPGVPLTLTLRLSASGCSGALVGARVDIWNADEHGVYSDEASEDTTGTDYLRGYQITDSTGTVRFTTIYPGWYAGRTNHVHLRVRTYSGSTVETDFITQLFFDPTSQAAMYTEYADTDSNDYTERDSDRVYEAEVTEGGANILSCTGSVADGYAATFVGSLSGTSASSTTVSGRIISAVVLRTSTTRRVVTVKLHAGESLTARVRLLHDNKVVAVGHSESVSRGTHRLRLAINNTVGHGTGQVTVALKDSDGDQVTKHRTVSIPA